MIRPEWIPELRDAYKHGVTRHDVNREVGTPGKYGNKNGPETREADGWAAVAECLVSLATGLPWIAQGYVKDDGVDVGDDISVRWTSYQSGHYILHPGDRDDLVAVLVVGRMPSMRIAGWMHPQGTAKRDEWIEYSARDTPYFVPQSAFHDWDLFHGWQEARSS